MCGSAEVVSELRYDKLYIPDDFKTVCRDSALSAKNKSIKKNEGDDDAKDGRKKGHRLNDTLKN